MKKLITSAILVSGLVFGTASVAEADPEGDSFDLTCGAATYQVVVAGNGGWTPAHDVNSNRMFIPTSFSGFTGQILDENGDLVDEFTDTTGSMKGQSARGKTIIDCTYSFVEVSDGSDPEFPAGYTFVGSGGVSGFVTPPGR